MWRLVLTVTLLCCGSEASVTCRDENNGEVDWFILYKVPTQARKLTGLEYLYIDSSRELTFPHINAPDGVLANTLRPLFSPVRSMPPNFGFINYNDQPPGSQAHHTFGHSKGVVMVEKDGTGVWLLHSTPQFPFRRDQNMFWPNSGNKNAQTFICVTFPYNQFVQIGTHLRDIRAFPFDYDVPLDFDDALQQVVNWEQKTPPPPPPPKFNELTARGGWKFYSIAKSTKDVENSVEGDLYITIAQKIQSDLKVQTWGCQKDRAKSYCGGGHTVYNIDSIKTKLGNWNPKSDHSKWCVSTDQNKPLTCIADVNRAESQSERRGGALCMKDDRITMIFQSFIKSTEGCSGPVEMDFECDSDTEAE
ncbi:plancitoxin-1-like [Channa argus]|uniref:plancitoxin-1-like n=1 Tax=Channa argus TaxID=215402 RepID=UPI003522DE72